MGIDGGGTRVRAVLADSDGTILGFGQGGPGSLTAYSDTVVEQSLSGALEEALGGRHAGGVSFTVAGLAGASSPEAVHRYEGILKRLGLDRVAVTTDAEIALAGGTGGTGIVLMAGTGSMAYGRTDSGEAVRAGGWGFQLGDEGGAAWIGLQAVRAAIRACDGLGPDTRLTGAVLSSFAIGRVESLKGIVASGQLTPVWLAALAPAVAEMAAGGDAVAQEIMESAAHELAGLLAALLRKGGWKSPVSVVKIGGLFDRAAGLAPCIERELAVSLPDVTLSEPLMAPVQGAVWMALQQTGAATPDALARLSEWRPGAGVTVQGR